MNYSYIEHLICRYFDCATTTHEERLLKDFFQQEEVPEQFARYKVLFCSLHDEGAIGLPPEFDAALAERIAAEQTVNSRKSYKQRLVALHRGMKPLYKAVASVALVISVGVASGEYWSRRAPEPVEYKQPAFHNAQPGSEVARECINDATDTLTIDKDCYQNDHL